MPKAEPAVATGSAQGSEFVKETQYKAVQKKLSETLEASNARRAKRAESESLKAALHRAKLATDEALSLHDRRKRAQEQMMRAHRRKVARELRREQRNAPGLDQAVGITSVGIRKAEADLRKLKELVRVAQRSGKKRVDELKEKWEAGKSAGKPDDSLKDEWENLSSLAAKKISEAESKVVKGKQRLARAEARKLAEDSGQFEGVLNIYTKRVAQSKSRLVKLNDELATAKKEELLAEQDVNKARGEEAGVAAAEKRRIQSMRTVTAIGDRLQKEEAKVQKDRQRVSDYEDKSGMSPVQAAEPMTADDIPTDSADQIKQRIRALDAKGSRSGDSVAPNNVSASSHHFMVEDPKKTTQTLQALANSIDEKKINDVKVLTKRLETVLFGNQLKEWQMPIKFRSVVESVRSLISEAHNVRASSAETQALLRSIVAQPREKNFPGWKAREKAATQIAASAALNTSMSLGPHTQNTSASVFKMPLKDERELAKQNNSKPAEGIDVSRIVNAIETEGAQEGDQLLVGNVTNETNETIMSDVTWRD